MHPQQCDYWRDLPVIGQLNVLRHVTDVEFLRQLGRQRADEKLVKDEPAFDRTLADTPGDRLVRRAAQVGESLSPEQKAELADRSRAFEDFRRIPQEKDRLRKLANDIRRAKMRPNCKRRWSPTDNGYRGIRPASRNTCERILKAFDRPTS